MAVGGDSMQSTESRWAHCSRALLLLVNIGYALNMVLWYKRTRIPIVHEWAMSNPLSAAGCERGLRANRMGIHKFLQKYKEMRSIERRPGSG